jgi:hydroxypyruvate reductase
MSRDLLEGAFLAGVEACRALALVQQWLPGRPRGRTIVLAAGKAAVPMAQAVEQVWDGLEGLVVTRRGYGGPLAQLELIEASHPVADAASEMAATRLLALAESAGEEDLVLVLLSGGASALLAAPNPPMTLADKQALTRALLGSGASIGEINLVRRHLSRIKGGRLAKAAWPARVVTLAVSDVTGDNPADIGSGPTVADAGTIGEARAVLARYGIAEPAGWSESVKPGAKELERASFRIVADAGVALDAVAAHLTAAGYAVELIAREATGEARAVAAEHAALALAARGRIALLSGGELTVTIKGKGRGGPNQEYALALALALNGTQGICALAADTDGVDGSHDVAGAYIDAGTLRALGEANARKALEANDAGTALDAIGALFVTGPTRTNINDLRMILIDPIGQTS